MPTVTAADLVAARAEGRAIGSFTTYNLETTLALRDAAENTGLPVIVQLATSSFPFVDRATLLGVVRAAVVGSPSRIGVHLGRSRELDEVAACLELGCSSVTFDGSHLPFEENVEHTRAAVALGRRAGAWVEGRLGAARDEDGCFDDPDAPGARYDLDAPGDLAGLRMTDPGRAAEFAARTGVDALAVQVGAVQTGDVHGVGGPGCFDLDRLAAIAAAVPVPLVLDATSGLTDVLLRGAISRGVAKINVDAELRRSAFAALGTTLTAARAADHDLRSLLESARRSVATTAANRARLFGLPGAG
ncbi:class II fructose-bisphosphate aldolase [Streptomyces sp. SL13]|uniref:Class II fructose-bisphosphate aldolase n=1 Tax=Streptantibioticus silvisoli TaxID=2705255 RepID=A0AA90H544_9ACTN|nr:class II fructose-bisphosphate aldolase [Streptantibioticus silvisoli]MDI5968990.1 class II fructose-bisphosphate aldolase [Streptantibioticus silvisoli]